MTSCPHSNLLLLPQSKKKRRCRYCHLKINADDLGESYCPECFENDGIKRYDFEEIAETNAPEILYRCEDCGALIKSI